MKQNLSHETKEYINELMKPNNEDVTKPLYKTLLDKYGISFIMEVNKQIEQYRS